MIVVVLCALIGVAGGWVGRRMMVSSSDSLLADLLAGVVGATAGGLVVRMFNVGGTSLVMTVLAAAVGAVAVTAARSVGQSQSRVDMASSIKRPSIAAVQSDALRYEEQRVAPSA